VGCLIGPERVADIGTAVTGVVAKMLVDRGDDIRKGAPLIVLESEIEQAGLKAAKARSAIDADVRAAEANLELASQKYKRAASLVDEGFVTPQAVEQARAERDVAVQKLAQARGQRVVQEQELGVVRAQLGQRTLYAPFDGVVAERFVNAGERAEDKPLLRVAMLDPLRVELVMPASRWGSVRSGEHIGVLPELPGASTLLARVTHVDRIIDAASNTFRVRLSLPNPGHRVPAGARCKVDGPGDSAAASGKPATGAAPAMVPAAVRSQAPARGSQGLKPTV
jgi:RND family efflux transporter MFP subunit